MPQHTFRREHDERRTPGSQRLTAQKMEILSGRGRRADLNIVFRRELQESFDASARVLRPLALITVREKQVRRPRDAPTYPRRR